MTAVPSCAGQCGFVQALILELARAHGLTEPAERVAHGLDTETAH